MEIFANWWQEAVLATPTAARKGTSSVIMLQLWKQCNVVIFDGAQPKLARPKGFAHDHNM
jgi:hypothetical protein